MVSFQPLTAQMAALVAETATNNTLLRNSLLDDIITGLIITILLVIGDDYLGLHSNLTKGVFRIILQKSKPNVNKSSKMHYTC